MIILIIFILVIMTLLLVTLFRKSKSLFETFVSRLF